MVRSSRLSSIILQQSQSYREDVHVDDRKVSEKQTTENGKVKKFLFNLHFGFFSGGIEMSGDGDSSSKKKRIATQKAK